MAISAQDVKKLRETTGAGIMDCKKALQEVDGIFDKAIEFLQKKSKANALKKAGRIASEGLVGSYIHGGGRIGVMIEVNCETDFVAKNEDFIQFVRDVSMHVAAMNPEFLDQSSVPAETIAHQRDIFHGQQVEAGKPEKIIGRIVDGKMKKWLSEQCLVNQAFVKDPDRTIEQLQTALISKIGENIKIRRYVRFELGEGLEKRTDDFAAEVASMQ